jgi:YegS/Rv2252/BmrU family lipid kinase
MHTLLLVNPVAGGGRGEKISKRSLGLLKAQGLNVDLQLTQSPGHAGQLAQAATDKGYQQIIVCGGDGTINEAVNGLKGNRINLGIIPCGRGNDLARYLGIPTKLKQACHICAQGRFVELDLVQINQRYCCSNTYVGLAAEVNKLANKSHYRHKGKGTYPYLHALWNVLPRFKSYQLKIEHDSGVYEGQMLMAVVGNISSFGGGLQITPNAVADDGLLDICIVETVSRRRLLYSVPAVFKGTHLKYDFVKYLRSSKIRISAHAPLDIYADGEFIQKLPADIQVHSKVLKIRTPGK